MSITNQNKNQYRNWLKILNTVSKPWWPTEKPVQLSNYHLWICECCHWREMNIWTYETKNMSQRRCCSENSFQTAVQCSVSIFFFFLVVVVVWGGGVIIVSFQNGQTNGDICFFFSPLNIPTSTVIVYGWRAPFTCFWKLFEGSSMQQICIKYF